MKMITARIPTYFYIWLENISEKTGKPMAHFVRESLKELHKNKSSDDESQREKL